MKRLGTKAIGLGTLFVLLISQVSAQNYLVQGSDNYGGLKALSLQPAAIADSRLKVDVNIASIDFTAWNNYVGIRSSGLYRGGFWEESDESFRQRFLVENDPNLDRRFFTSIDIHMPSVMVSLSEKHSIAFNWRWRTHLNVHNIDYELGKLALEELNYPDLWGREFNNDQFNIQGMNWAEYGLSYARVLHDERENFWKAGATVKYVQGITAGYLYARDLNYEFTNDTLLSLRNSEFAYGFSDNLDFGSSMLTDYRQTANPTVGFDLGVVYEHRPDYREYTYLDEDDNSRKPRQDLNKYQFRVGASLLDIGRVRFNKIPESRNFRANVEEWDLNRLNFTSPQDFGDTITNRFGSLDDDSDFTMTLPTALSLQFDYRFTDVLFLNFTTYLSARNLNNEERLKGMNNFSLTPRWETPWGGAAIPISINEFGDFNLGLHGRIGPFTLGVNDLSTMLWKDQFRGVHFHLGISAKFPYRDPTIRPDPDPDDPPDPEPVVEEEEVEEKVDPTEGMRSREVYDYLAENFPDHRQEDLRYVIQLGAYSIEPDIERYSEMDHHGDLKVVFEADLYKVQIHIWETLGEVDPHLREIQENHIPTAFVGVYQDGERIRIFQLRDILFNLQEDENDE